MTNSPEFERYKSIYPKAVQAGLAASAAIYAGLVRAKLAGGYTSGAFSTGEDARSVEVGAFFDERGDSALRIGSNVLRTLWWEMGHMNHFTKRFERVEHWRHALDESGDAMTAAYQDAFNAVMTAELG